ncbi:hypothetical protein RFI_05694 [Reticulomyxa filosa]|uniref:Uncharacterized protein n=1 Tax=Reticulomyxa filosa TaxID=46433 RepID=X6NZX8_RETFI|nr:hypothetical protein RFI_05694 [Reticulomyxa filosa]|eukprot:ETO31428.1 hypothetical protein RFI_05694 [Reticulomyxa filosa]
MMVDNLKDKNDIPISNVILQVTCGTTTKYWLLDPRIEFEELIKTVIEMYPELDSVRITGRKVETNEKKIQIKIENEETKKELTELIAWHLETPNKEWIKTTEDWRAFIEIYLSKPYALNEEIITTVFDPNTNPNNNIIIPLCVLGNSEMNKSNM